MTGKVIAGANCPVVMAGLVPAIHAERLGTSLGSLGHRNDVDARDKPGHDGGEIE